MRIVINSDQFEHLVAGEVLTHTLTGIGIEIALADLGVVPMLKMIAGRGPVAGGELMFELGQVRTRQGRAKTAAATSAICDCGCPFFATFQVEGTDHPHLQCAACGVSYCPGGKCE